MKLGLSSIAYINDGKLQGKFERTIDLILEASEKCLNFAEKNNIAVCELLLDPPVLNSEEHIEEFVGLCNSFPKIQKQVHGPYYDLNLCSLHPNLRKAAIDCYLETAAITSRIGAKIYTIHPGAAKHLNLSNRLFYVDALASSVKILMEDIKKYNLITCIENMQRKIGILLDLKELELFFEKVKGEEIFFCWDTSHSWTNDVDVQELWNSLHDKIRNVHLVDNYQKAADSHPALGKGKIDFKEIFNVMETYDYEGAVILEIGKSKDVPESVDYIQKYFN